MSSSKINSQKENVPHDENSAIFQLASDLTSRIDERVKFLTEKQKEIEILTKELSENALEASHRLQIIENKTLLHEKFIEESKNKLQDIGIKTDNIALRLGHHDNRWTQIFDSVWKILLMCVAGYILYKLGIQAPPG